MSPAEREEHVVFLSAVRTGFGSFGGTLKDHSATDLGVFAAQCAVARAGIAPSDVGHVIFGNVVQTSTDAAYLARHVGLRAGLPHRGSGRHRQPALRLRLRGDHPVRAPYSAGRDSGRAGGRDRVHESGPVRAPGCALGNAAGTTARAGGQPLGLAARHPVRSRDGRDGRERLGERYGVTRADADAYALSSQRRAKAAWDAGAFRDEVIPVPVRNPKTRQTVEWAVDEHMRPDTTPEASGEARAGVPQGRTRDRRERIRRLRRRCGARRRGRALGPRARAPAARPAASAGPLPAWTRRSWESAPRPRPGRRSRARGSPSAKWIWSR